MDERKPKVARRGDPTALDEKLPYCIELWDGNGRALERVLARAVNAALARAIFKAAQTEHPDRRIILRRGIRTVADSTE